MKVYGEIIFNGLDIKTAPTPLKVYLNRLNDLALFLNQSLYLSLQGHEVHMTVYPEGSFYKRHLDQFKGTVIASYQSFVI